jgi:hypothetical protein
MKSITQIKNRLRNERIDSKYSPSHRQNIKVLEWVLEGKDLSMCEANSNAILGDVRAEINKLKFKSDIIEKSEKVGEGQLLINYNKGLMDALEIFNKKISEHFR